MPMLRTICLLVCWLIPETFLLATPLPVEVHEGTGFPVIWGPGDTIRLWIWPALPCDTNVVPKENAAYYDIPSSVPVYLNGKRTTWTNLRHVLLTKPAQRMFVETTKDYKIRSVEIFLKSK